MKVCDMVFQLPMGLLYGLFFSFGCKDCSDTYIYKNSKFENREKMGAERGFFWTQIGYM